MTQVRSILWPRSFWWGVSVRDRKVPEAMWSRSLCHTSSGRLMPDVNCVASAAPIAQAHARALRVVQCAGANKRYVLAAIQPNFP